jgi:FkbM family methyltransferase
LRQNLELNPKYSSVIEIIERPIWETSEKVFYMVSNGPGSRISESPLGNDALEVKTLSIDDMVRDKKLPRVDFIKMDIEGAELPALKGALDTLNRFKPTLAICVYHKADDWISIPLFINSLNLGYKMWLDHYTIFAEETVLFCKSV